MSARNKFEGLGLFFVCSVPVRFCMSMDSHLFGSESLLLNAALRLPGPLGSNRVDGFFEPVRASSPCTGHRKGRASEGRTKTHVLLRPSGPEMPSLDCRVCSGSDDQSSQ